MKNVIDISNNQGKIDFAKVKASGIDGIIIRVGWGGDIARQDDPKFNEYVAECEKYGIPYGFYLYSYALTLKAIDSEVKHTIRVMGNHKPALGVWFDMEDADHYKKNHGLNVYSERRLITDMCKSFCRQINQAGYECGIYANLDYFKHVIYYDEVKGYRIWLAQWGVGKPSIDCDMWQYTSNGKCDGIKGRIDADICYLSDVKDGKPVPVTEKTYTIEEFRRDVRYILGTNSDRESFEKTVTINSSILCRNRSHALVTPLERYMKAFGYYNGEIEADKGKKPIFGNGMKTAIKNYQQFVVKSPVKYCDGELTAKAQTWKKLLLG